MKNFDLITLQPTRLACIVLQDWLKFKSVMALDSAYCSHSHRSDFADLLQSDEYFIREHVTLQENCDGKMLQCGEKLKQFDLRMIERFGEKLRSVSIQGTLNAPSQMHSLAEHCHHLTHVNYSRMKNKDYGLWEVLESNVHIEYLGVCSGSSAVGVAGNIIPKLKALGHSKLTDEQIIKVMRKSDTIVRFKRSIVPNNSKLLHMCHLTCLGLAEAQISDEILQNITSLNSGIVKLDLHANRDLTDAGILSMVQNLKQLQSLNILNVTDASLVHLYTHSANTLHTLFCGGMDPVFTTAAVNTLLNRCTQLRVLHFEEGTLEYNPDPDIRFLPESLGKLTTLALSGGVCMQNLSVVAKYAVNLEVLYIFDFTRESLMEVWNGCPKLKELFFFLRSDYEEPNVHFCEIFLFAMDLWMKLRPGLVIKRCTCELLKYDVMEMI